MDSSCDSGARDTVGIRATAAAWIRRRAAGMSAAERDEFHRWIALDPLHGAVLAEMNTAGDDCDWMWHAGAVEEVTAGLEKRRVRRRRTRHVVGSVSAAAVLVFATLSWRARQPESSGMAGVPKESLLVIEPQRRQLPDGSRVELRPGAEIEVDFSGAARRVALLRGEAFFDVAKDVTRPFVVAAGAVEVRAVGTEFTVQLNAASVDVLVAEGTVALDQPTNASVADSDVRPPATQLALIDRGNRASVPVTAPGAVPIEPVSEHELAEKLAWRVPRLEFTTTPLRNVLARFEGYNRVRAVLVDPELGDLRISGVLRADRLDSLVEMLESDFGVRVERPNNDEIRLRKKG